MNDTEHTARLPLKVKLAYSVGEFGTYILLLLNAAFLLYFYTDVIGIPGKAAAVIFMVARIWDAVNDPMMGVIVDKKRTPIGKCRYFLKYFSVPAGICLALTFIVPNISVGKRIAWVAVTYIMQGMANTAIQVPSTTLMARLSTDKYERVSLGQFRAGGVILANLLIPAITLPLVELFGRGTNPKMGYAILAILYGVVYAVTHLVEYWGTKGYEMTDEQLAAAGMLEAPRENVKIGAMLKAVVQNKVALILCACYILYQLYAAMMGSTLVYYMQYNLKNTDLMSIYSVLSTVTGFVPILLLRVLVKKYGNAGACGLACGTVAIGELARFVTNDMTWALYFGWALEGVGLALFSSLLLQCMFDAITYGEWKNGVRNEAVLMSTLTFAQKAGQALGGVVAAAMLDVFGYVPQLAEQTTKVLRLFFAENVAIPLVLFVVMIFIFLYLGKIEKKIPDMKMEIARRQGAGAIE